jgi:hypothetical protein
MSGLTADSRREQYPASAHVFDNRTCGRPWKIVYRQPSTRPGFWTASSAFELIALFPQLFSFFTPVTLCYSQGFHGRCRYCY